MKIIENTIAATVALVALSCIIIAMTPIV